MERVRGTDMFWDRVAGVYDLFVNVVNRKTHRQLKQIVAAQIARGDTVLECACGTGLLSAAITEKCGRLTATDFSTQMLKRAKKNCAAFRNITFSFADITALPYPDNSFDKIVAANVIHLLDAPEKALAELNRVVKPAGLLIIPTYINKGKKGETNAFAKTVGKAGADFKRQFTAESYRQFFSDAGYADVKVTVAEGRIPCAVAVMKKVSR
ncbi:MAG: methyltransferase domain-containing protein [Oscillospiraceae bacterium]|nr:methyltransferase domain-containing protein [Oscillospiraceae bacterium]